MERTTSSQVAARGCTGSAARRLRAVIAVTAPLTAEQVAVERAVTLPAGGSRRIRPLQRRTSLVGRSSTAPQRGGAVAEGVTP